MFAKKCTFQIKEIKTIYVIFLLDKINLQANHNTMLICKRSKITNYNRN